ncbi:hypothetical protein O0L34_g12153 [Tuta absoluta]|nr:hypothetical protein O0L34_g12153 [Tuta absoluta]
MPVKKPRLVRFLCAKSDPIASEISQALEKDGDWHENLTPMLRQKFIDYIMESYTPSSIHNVNDSSTAHMKQLVTACEDECFKSAQKDSQYFHMIAEKFRVLFEQNDWVLVYVPMEFVTIPL